MKQISRSKAKRVYEAGAAVYKGSPPAAQEKLLKAIALMICEAAKPASKVKKAEQEPLPFGPGALYELCLNRVPHIIACTPYDKRWFARLGKELQSTEGLEYADMERFVSWVESGGLGFFTDCTFAHVIKHWTTWLPKARKAVGSTGTKGFEEFMG